MIIESPRLLLERIPTEVLQLRLQNVPFAWEGIEYPDEWPGEAVRLFPLWLKNRARNPEAIEWGGAVIEKLSQTAIGMISAKGTPQNGVVEIGYGFNRSVWGQGFATETVDAFCHWIFQQPDITEIWASTRPENVASGRVLIKNHFEYDGDITDPDEGRLLRYRKQMPGFTA